MDMPSAMPNMTPKNSFSAVQRVTDKLQVAASLVFLILFVTYAVRSQSRRTKLKLKFSLTQKIFFNYLQCMSVFVDVQPRFKASIRTVMRWQSYADMGSLLETKAFDCFFANYWVEWSLIALFPVIMVFITYAILGLLHHVHKRSVGKARADKAGAEKQFSQTLGDDVWCQTTWRQRTENPHTRFLTCVLVCLYIGYMTMIRKFAALLKCEVYDDGDGYRANLLLADATIDCDDDFVDKMQVLAFCLLLVVGIGVPCGMMLKLEHSRRKQRKELLPADDPHNFHSKQMIAKYGFLYAMKKERFFWWELVVQSRKFLLLIVPALMGPDEKTYMLFLLMIIAELQFLVTIVCSPYVHRYHLLIELLCLWSLSITAHCALLLEMIDEMSEAAAWGIFVAMLLFNVGATVSCAWYFVRDVKAVLGEKIVEKLDVDGDGEVSKEELEMLMDKLVLPMRKLLFKHGSAEGWLARKELSETMLARMRAQGSSGPY